MNVALALQSYTELEPFIENNQSFLVPSGGQQVLDLSAAPILFHLQSDMELMEYIKSCDNNVDNLDAKRVCTTQLHISSCRLYIQNVLNMIYCDSFSIPFISDLRKGNIRKRNRDGPRPLQDLHR